MNKSKAKKRLESTLYILLTLSFVNGVMLLLLPSYKNYSAISSLSFSTADGWCNSGEGIGSHCFGDFYYNFNFSDLSAPWGQAPNPYPPLSVILFKFFKILLDNTSHRHLSLNIYLLVSVTAMLFPSFHLLKKRLINKNVFFPLSGMILMSAPMIMSFDRGNLQMIMTPFIYLCIYYFITNDEKRFLIISCILVSLKPQYILLGMLLVAKRDAKNLTKWITATSLTFLSTFLLFPINILQNVKDYFHQVESFNHYVPLGSLYPANLSLSSTLSLFYRFFSVNNAENANIANNFYIPSWVTITILFSCIFLFWKMGQSANQYSLLYLVICFPLLLPGVTFAYHATPLVLFFIFLGVKINSDYQNPINQKFSPSFFIENRFTFILTVSITVLLFIPWSIPWNIIPRYANLPDGNMTMTWTLLQLLVLILFTSTIMNIYKSRKGSK